ncbi:flavodoxin family protein [Methanogenium organophilum]|uniref:ArsR family transcriptional regulator n=1 Tax=Methanogenium organophilum TaxID=2199 RepID=A0A9X9S610_METOG|nr:ArsR family transcriptional regulator [Methanogenium organophilum]WAI02326.1 ArsR family transcriptional regulator [Methanogenium organophilum]
MTPDTDTAPAETPPAVAIIYHSETGHTRAIARNAAEKTGATLIEVRPERHYCRMGKYLRGGIRAVTGRKDAIYPAEINISPFDIIIIGTPVWSQHPTPVITGAVAALRGVKEGTRAIVFTTCMAHAGRATAPLKEALRQVGIPVQQSYTFPNRYPAGACGTVLAKGVETLRTAKTGEKPN